MELKRITFYSRQNSKSTALEIENFVIEQRNKYSKKGVSGILLFSKREFFGILEAPSEITDQEFDHLKLEPEVKELRLLLKSENTMRFFDSFHLGYINPNSMNSKYLKYINRNLHFNLTTLLAKEDELALEMAKHFITYERFAISFFWRDKLNRLLKKPTNKGRAMLCF